MRLSDCPFLIASSSKKQHMDLTIKIIKDKYENVMGFKPQLDVKKKPDDYEDARRLKPSITPSQTN